jgi:hypothetical protein
MTSPIYTMNVSAIHGYLSIEPGAIRGWLPRARNGLWWLGRIRASEQAGRAPLRWRSPSHAA